MAPRSKIRTPKRRWVVAAATLACIAATVGWRRSLDQRPAPTEAIEPCAAVSVCFLNHGEPTGPVGVLLPSRRADDPVLTYFWREADELERGLLEALELAARSGATGEGRIGRRRAALDLSFGSNHSRRIVLPGADGARVGEIVVDRSQPSEGRLGLATALDALVASHAGRFRDVGVHTVFLLSCGSKDDVEDVARVAACFTALTGSPPARILTTSDKVVPYYWHIAPGFADARSLEIYEASPAGNRSLFLRIAPGGWLDLASGAGAGILRPHRP